MILQHRREFEKPRYKLILRASNIKIKTWSMYSPIYLLLLKDLSPPK